MSHPKNDWDAREIIGEIGNKLNLKTRVVTPQKNAKNVIMRQVIGHIVS